MEFVKKRNLSHYKMVTKMKRILTEEHKRKIKEALLKRVKEGIQKGLFPKGFIPAN